jgi:hypothetical protein
LREIEESGETDDEAVYFAEGGEAEDFGGVVAEMALALIFSSPHKWETRGLWDSRNSRIVQRTINHEKANISIRSPRVRNNAQDTNRRS